MNQRSPYLRPSRISLLISLALGVLVLVFWDTRAVLPLQLFVVFAHEASHAVATWLTGGTVERIDLSIAEGGMCVSSGGSPVVILNAGYLGSLLVGVVLLLVAVKSRLDRLALAAVASGVVFLTLFYMQSAFGLVYGLSAGAVLLVVAWKLPDLVADMVLRVLGIVSCLYAVWDIASDVIFRSVRGSDASALAERTGIPALAWGALWLMISSVLLLWVLRSMLRESSR